MKLDSPCEKALNVFPLPFRLVAEEVADVDESFRKANPAQEVILVHEKTEVKNFSMCS